MTDMHQLSSLAVWMASGVLCGLLGLWLGINSRGDEDRPRQPLPLPQWKTSTVTRRGGGHVSTDQMVDGRIYVSNGNGGMHPLCDECGQEMP